MGWLSSTGNITRCCGWRRRFLLCLAYSIGMVRLRNLELIQNSGGKTILVSISTSFQANHLKCNPYFLSPIPTPMQSSQESSSQSSFMFFPSVVFVVSTSRADLGGEQEEGNAKIASLLIPAPPPDFKTNCPREAAAFLFR